VLVGCLAGLLDDARCLGLGLAAGVGGVAVCLLPDGRGVLVGVAAVGVGLLLDLSAELGGLGVRQREDLTDPSTQVLVARGFGGRGAGGVQLLDAGRQPVALLGEGGHRRGQLVDAVVYLGGVVTPEDGTELG
jgi:hypothetical protein